MGWLDGMVALITGGGSGLGRAVAGRYVAEGARVAVLDRSEQRLDALCSELPGVVTIQGEVASLEDNQRAVASAIGSFGRLDIFVGNAGIYDNMVSLKDIPADRLSDAFDELFGVNVKGYLLGAKASLTELERTGGCIIFTASVSGLQAGYGGALYVPAKHAVVGLTRQLAHELAPAIRVNAVAPGGVSTNLAGITSLDQHPSLGGARRAALRDPNDYAGLYVLLASAENSGVLTGTILAPDTGRPRMPDQRVPEQQAAGVDPAATSGS